MINQSFKGKYAIVGLGVTKVGHVPGVSGRAFQAEAARLAIEDAGLKIEDIDGCINAKQESGSQTGGDWTDAFPRVLGLPCKAYFHAGRGGGSALCSLASSLSLLDMGVCKYVIVAYGGKGWSRGHRGRQLPYPPGTHERPGYWSRALGDLKAFSCHSFFASRHMYEYGTTSEHLGWVAVSERKWANLNPHAFMYGRPMTIEDHQKSPILVWPYHLLDICLESDGGSALVVTTSERAKYCRKPPAYILGMGFGEHMRKLWWDKQNYTQLDIEPAKEDAFAMAGIELKDIDAAQLYDCFTSEVIFQLEGYGWCKRGEGGPFVASGAIAPGGTIPVNTGGGELSSHHHSGFTPLAECIIQTRGEGGARQVKDAEICLATGHGGEIVGGGMCSTHIALILGRNK